MKISPIELHQKVFSKKMFGYDPDEVDHYLREVANYLESVLSEQAALKDTLREKDLRLMEYKEREQSLQAAIQGATQMAEKMREDAQREARLIISDAEHKAEALVRDARDNLRKIYAEISNLKRARIQFESSFKALMNAHLNLIEEGNRIFDSFEIKGELKGKDFQP